jgi:hypothetical protein
MKDDKFAAILAMLVPQVVALIMNRRSLADKEAIKLLYTSKLYGVLETEATKLWHLSAETLYTLLDEELTTGEIIFPEEA